MEHEQIVHGPYRGFGVQAMGRNPDGTDIHVEVRVDLKTGESVLLHMTLLEFHYMCNAIFNGMHAIDKAIKGDAETDGYPHVQQN